MDVNLGNLEEEALKRKQRLRQLKQKQSTHHDEPTFCNIAAEEGACVPKPIFRNYEPVSDQINDLKEISAVNVVDVGVGLQLEMMKTPIVIEEIDIANLAPRKPDWDLKRDVSKKLEKLDRRTQKAIASLIRERLRSAQDQNILLAVNIGTINGGATE
ncbi:coiled-coil domain-containing protein 12 [Anopheles cruzii]|uniref:coiled-coil domain-containing protein 12 n=1 Tax=Anopheles cruzii TaxID=68878 RepID=UPI0022EC1AE4|nr:coiled-coil domain-containing protein 12 [Anopheles cruzii]